MTFPKIERIKPRKYKPTGSSELYKGKCIIYFGSPDKQFRDAKDLYVLWHEIIHSLETPSEVWKEIDEKIANFYECLVCEIPRKEIERRLLKGFENYPRRIQAQLLRTFRKKRASLLQLKFELAKILSYQKFKWL